MAQSSATITIDAAAPRRAVSPEMYGIFFEEINHAGDGGLYAELVQNRDMEASVVPEGWRIKDELIYTPLRWRNLEQGIPDPPPTTASTQPSTRPAGTYPKWFQTDLPGWSFITEGDADGSMAMLKDDPLNERNPHSLRLTVNKLGERCGIANSGYWGMNIVKGEMYDFSLYARTAEGRGIGIKVSLESPDGKVICARQTLPELGRRNVGDPQPHASGEWRKYGMGILAMESHPNCRLVIEPVEAGTLWFDVVSLFPRKTFKNRPNGMRPDLAQMLVDMKPGFLRFPGGCVVEGATLHNRIRWKDSIGDVAQRTGDYNVWGYRNTYGIGHHEFLQLAEDLGAEAMFVCNVGLSCQARGRQPTEMCTDEDLPKYIQEALDAIEYAVGPATSEWGAKRAANGRTEPFKLKYVEIGNENRGPEYHKRYKAFYDAIKAKYPQIITIADERVPDAPIEIVDDHFYRNPTRMLSMANEYNNAPRNGPKIYVGEYAVNREVGAGNLRGAIAEAVFTVNMERNADQVIMCSYAPLFENVNDRRWPVNLIQFDSHRVIGRSSYHVQKLFAQHRPDEVLQTDVKAEAARVADTDVQQLYSTAGFDRKNGHIVVKVVNPTTAAVSATISLKNLGQLNLSQINQTAQVITLGHADPTAENSLENPNVVVPVESTMSIGGPEFSASFGPNSLTIIRVSAVMTN